MLRTFAGLLRSRFRDADLVARFGGEEFVVVLEGATRDDAVRIADEVRALLANRQVLDDDGVRSRGYGLGRLRSDRRGGADGGATAAHG